MSQAILVPDNLGKTLKPAGQTANKIDVNVDDQSFAVDATTGVISAKIDPSTDNLLKKSAAGLKVDADDLGLGATLLVKDAFGADLFLAFPKPII